MCPKLFILKDFYFLIVKSNVRPHHKYSSKWVIVGNESEILNLWETKNKENTRQNKQSHTQDNIYVVRQFAYIHEIARILLLLGKNTKCGYSVSVSQERQQQPYKPPLRPSLHGLSLRKSPIKNHATLFRVRSGRQPDQT